MPLMQTHSKQGSKACFCVLSANDLFVQGGGTTGPSDNTRLLPRLHGSANSGIHMLNPEGAWVS